MFNLLEKHSRENQPIRNLLCTHARSHAAIGHVENIVYMNIIIYHPPLPPIFYSRSVFFPLLLRIRSNLLLYSNIKMDVTLRNAKKMSI